jgi:hypothetical protein
VRQKKSARRARAASVGAAWFSQAALSFQHHGISKAFVVKAIRALDGFGQHLSD